MARTQKKPAARTTGLEDHDPKTNRKDSTPKLEGNKLSTLGRAALVYAKAGFPVFPCLPREKAPHSDLVPHGHKEATTDPKVISKWWSEEPEANIGLVPGPGYAVVDVDPYNGGDRSFRKIANGAEGAFKATLQAETGGGGFHYLFSEAPQDLPGKLAEGIDLKRHGRGYIVVSPSIHPSGKRYKWIGGFHADEIQPWPECLVPVSRSPKSPSKNSSENRQPLTPTQLKKLLKAIDADDYENWIAVGQALRQDYGDDPGFGLWRRWSKQSDKYPGDVEIERKWNSFRSGGRGTGTLVFLAGGKLPAPSADEEFADAPIPEEDREPKFESSLQVTPFSDLVEKKVDWLVPGYVAKGVLHCVAGYGGEGKSSALSALVAGCTKGLNWINGDPLPIGPTSVAMITEEPLAYQTLPRLRLAGADLRRVLNVDGITTTKGNLEPWNLVDHEKKTREFLKAHPEVQMLLIDPIGSYMHGKKREINTWKDSDVRAALGPWQRLAEETNIAIIYIAHHAKGKADRAMNLVTGSAAFTTVTRMSYAVMEPANGYLKQFGIGGSEFEDEEDEPKKNGEDLSGLRVLFATKVNIGPMPPPVVLKFEHVPDNDNPKVTAIGMLPRIKAEELMEQLRATDKGETQEHPLQDKILEYVTEHPGDSKNAICTALGVKATNESSQRAFKVMESKGLIRTVKQGNGFMVFPMSSGDADLFE